jgi:hypothetical protein
MTFRHKYDGVGFPCRKTIGSPVPTSTQAIRPFEIEKPTLVLLSSLRQPAKDTQLPASTTSNGGRSCRMMRRLSIAAKRP